MTIPGQLSTGCVLALDVGGTDIKGAIVGSDYRIVSRLRRPTGAEHGTSAVLGSMLQALHELRADAEADGLIVKAAGVSVTGIVDEAKGIAIHSANVGWDNSPLRSIISQELGLPTGLGHDVRAGGLAESRLGAGRPFTDFVFVAVGTGVSSAIIVNSQVVVGGGYAGEIGHVDAGLGVACKCGGTGCVEAVASAASIGRRYSELSGVAVPGAKEVAARMVAGDELARDLWMQAVDALAVALAWTTGVVGPQAIVIGGGLARSGDLLFEPLAKVLASKLPVAPLPLLLPAQFTDEAGCLGSALIAWGASAADDPASFADGAR